MNPTQALCRAGQSLWLDNLTRELLTSGTLQRYIDELPITGLTSNPTIFNQAIKKGTAYDASIREQVRTGKSGEKLFFEIALEDITSAADLFRPVHERTAGVDGWVSLEVWLRGIERRIEANLNPAVPSVASIFLSRWDVAVAGKVPPALTNMLGIAIGEQAYSAYARLLESTRWRRVFNAGARPQRLLFASTGTKDPKAPDILYIKALVAPLTINTMPEATLKAFADHGALGSELRADGGDSEKVLGKFRNAGIDLDALAAKLQEDGAASFATSWNELLGVIASKGSSLAQAS